MPARFFTADGPHLYGKYLTDVINWAEVTDFSDLPGIYAAGYLPFSGDTADPRHLFYMARSLRVDMGSFSLKKKRRYDHKGWKRFGLVRQLLTKAEFIDRHGAIMLQRARAWMEPRFGEEALSLERLEYILSKPYLGHVLSWYDGRDLKAFALIVRGQWGAHYWYVFYENGTGAPSAPGHGFLIDFLNWCHQEKLPFAYLGTTYAGKSRYKSRGIKGTEFWHDNKWQSDMKVLGHLQEQDGTLTGCVG